MGYYMSELEERRVRETLTNLPAADLDISWLSNMEEKYIVQDE